MSFENHYPNRKDVRRPYRKSKAFDATCRPHGSCPYCRGNRLHGAAVRGAARPDPREQPADIDDDDDDDGDDGHDPFCPR